MPVFAGMAPEILPNAPEEPRSLRLLPASPAIQDEIRLGLR